MSGAALLLHELRYDQKLFWRNPASVFFTVALPVIFLLIFATIFGDELVQISSGAQIDVSAYYVPGIMALAIVSATFVSLAISLTQLREGGELKRLRATPLPTSVFIAGRVGSAFTVSVLMMVIVVAVGAMLYGVAVPFERTPGILITLVVGAAAFCCLGFALTAAIPTENAAPAITNVAALPLYFLSGIFIPESEIPTGLLTVADLFPIRHLFQGLLTAYDPLAGGAGIDWASLAVLAAWGLAGLALAVRTFRWMPRG